MRGNREKRKGKERKEKGKEKGKRKGRTPSQYTSGEGWAFKNKKRENRKRSVQMYLISNNLRDRNENLKVNIKGIER